LLDVVLVRGVSSHEATVASHPLNKVSICRGPVISSTSFFIPQPEVQNLLQQQAYEISGLQQQQLEIQPPLPPTGAGPGFLFNRFFTPHKTIDSLGRATLQFGIIISDRAACKKKQ